MYLPRVELAPETEGNSSEAAHMSPSTETAVMVGGPSFDLPIPGPDTITTPSVKNLPEAGRSIALADLNSYPMNRRVDARALGLVTGTTDSNQELQPSSRVTDSAREKPLLASRGMNEDI